MVAEHMRLSNGMPISVQIPFKWATTAASALISTCKQGDMEKTHLTIGSDVWIGRNVTILAGVRRIGNGTVIGACAVVTHDVPDYAIVAGNPARVVKYR